MLVVHFLIFCWVWGGPSGHFSQNPTARMTDAISGNRGLLNFLRGQRLLVSMCYSSYQMLPSGRHVESRSKLGRSTNSARLDTQWDNVATRSQSPRSCYTFPLWRPSMNINVLSIAADLVGPLGSLGPPGTLFGATCQGWEIPG